MRATLGVTGTSIVDKQTVDAFGGLGTVISCSQINDPQAVDLSTALRRAPDMQDSGFNLMGSFGGDEGVAVYLRGIGASRSGQRDQDLRRRRRAMNESSR